MMIGTKAVKIPRNPNFFVQLFISADSAQPGIVAQGDFRYHQAEAEGYHQHDIHQQENTAAVLCGKIWKAPNVSQSHGGTGGSQNKSQPA